ncbi:MAG: hypothetical protein QW212_01085 [Nitrososphaerales archaeon]
MKRISWLFLLAGVIYAQPQPQPQAQQVPPPPSAQVEVEMPKDVREYIELQRNLLKEQKKSELIKIKRAEKFESLQSNLSSLQHQKSILLEKKSIELIKRLPPVFYSVETSGVVGSYAISKDGVVITEGQRIGTAQVSSISVEKGFLLEDRGVVYPGDSSRVKTVFSDLYQETRQVSTPPPPPPPVLSPNVLLPSPPQAPPPPPPVR